MLHCFIVLSCFVALLKKLSHWKVVMYFEDYMSPKFGYVLLGLASFIAGVDHQAKR
jgi:hypothetical protein